jgi:hypothetical protein
MSYATRRSGGASFPVMTIARNNNRRPTTRGQAALAANLPDRRVAAPSLRNLERTQHAVVARQQLLDAGLTRDVIDAQLEACRWRALNDQVLVLHNGALTRRQQLWAVLLSAQTPAALCAFTVLELLTVTGFMTEVVHVLIRRGARVLPVPGVVVDVHESRRFGVDNVVRLSGYSVTSMTRSAIDAAVWSRDVVTGYRVLVAVVQQLGLRPGDLITELEQAGKVRQRRPLLRLLADLEGGAQALSEVDFLAFCRRHGFPKPTLQARLDSGGRRRYLDAKFRRSDGSVFHVEVDGGVHLTLATRWKDTRKDNDAALDRQLVLRFPSVAIHTDDEDAIRQMREALRLRAA